MFSAFLQLTARSWAFHEHNLGRMVRLEKSRETGRKAIKLLLSNSTKGQRGRTEPQDAELSAVAFLHIYSQNLDLFLQINCVVQAKE